MAVRVAENSDAKAVAEKTGTICRTTGTISYSFAWNKDALFAVVKKSASGDTVKFSFDGKSAKNAFLSYPDRIVVCSPGDSIIVNGIHFRRNIENNAMVYHRQEWRNEISYEVVGDNVVVRIPWYDTGMIPFEERTIGFAAFVTDARGRTVSQVPSSAQFFIPATWGMLLLQK
jgi:hypothetical protein